MPGALASSKGHINKNQCQQIQSLTSPLRLMNRQFNLSVRIILIPGGEVFPLPFAAFSERQGSGQRRGSGVRCPFVPTLSYSPVHSWETDSQKDQEVKDGYS